MPSRPFSGKMAMLFTLAVLSVSSTAETSVTESNQPQLNLEKCFVKGVKSQALCGTYTVAENRAKAMNEQNKIDLNIVVLPKFKEESKGAPVYFLAGGPGQAATELAGVANTLLSEVRQQHDIYLVDQRGTGKSGVLACSEPSFDPLSFDDRTLNLEEEVTKCLNEFNTSSLESYNSIDFIKDLEAVRNAAGYEKVHLIGGSYGTRAGFTYLQQFPESVATATLDSNAPMQLVIGLFGKTSERAFDLLVEDCQAHIDCNKAFPNLKDDYIRLTTRLKQSPVIERMYHPHSGEPVDMILTAQKVTSTLRTTLYNLSSRAITPYAVHSAANGDYRMLASLIGASSEPERAPGQMYMGLTLNILCNEDIPRALPSDFENDADNYFNGKDGFDAIKTMCEYWPRWDVAAGFNEPLKTAVPVLLFSGKYDPVTPPAYGDMAMETLENAKHVVIEQGSHTASFSKCAMEIAEFIDTGDFKEVDFSCAKKVQSNLFLIDKNQIK
jgi:pimeloyl-ACP methyl ester carboxylesterase